MTPVLFAVIKIQNLRKNRRSNGNAAQSVKRKKEKKNALHHKVLVSAKISFYSKQHSSSPPFPSPLLPLQMMVAYTNVYGKEIQRGMRTDAVKEEDDKEGKERREKERREGVIG